MLIAAICTRYGWTYDEYLDQPNKLINATIDMMKIDAQKEKAESTKIRN